MFIFKMIRRAFIAFLLVTLIGYGALEVAAKNFAESKLEELAREKNALAQDAEAEVSVPLLYGILFKGRIERVQIFTTQIDVGPFLADRSGAELRGIQIDRAATLAEREPVIESIEVLEMMLEFTAEQASKVLPEGLSFEFLPSGEVRLSGPNFQVEGRLVIIEGPVIRFDPDPGEPLPPLLAQPSWSFSEIPFVTCISKIEIVAPLARVTCTQHDPPPRFPPR